MRGRSADGLPAATGETEDPGSLLPVWRPIVDSAILRGHEKGTCFSGGQSPGSDGQVAQLVEQRTENPCVGGSIPPLATNEFCFQLKHWPEPSAFQA